MAQQTQRAPQAPHAHHTTHTPLTPLTPQTTRYKSEVFVPIRKDSKSFEERQKSIWEEMQARMERRRREWQEEVEHMRADFFKLKPLGDGGRGIEGRSTEGRSSSENVLASRPLSDVFYADAGGGTTVGGAPVGGAAGCFRVSFEVSEFSAAEISVRTHEHKLIVHARHEEAAEGRSLSREFSRTIDIPKHVDPESLTCCLSNDGILQVEAPVPPAPKYDQIEDSVRHGAGTQPRGAGTETRAGPISVQHEGSKKFRIVVDIGPDYSPSDVTVKTIDKKLVLHARHEEKGQCRSSVKSISREFDLPASVDPNRVTASMTDDGKLILEAPISNYTHGSYSAKPGSNTTPTITICVGK